MLGKFSLGNSFNAFYVNDFHAIVGRLTKEKEATQQRQ